MSGRNVAHELPGNGRIERAERFELLCQRAELLAEPERRLVEPYLKQGMTFRQLARLVGWDERRLARRIRTLCARLLAGEYITIVRHGELFGEELRRLAYDRFIRGMSCRALAERYGMSFWKARKRVAVLEAFAAEQLGRDGRRDRQGSAERGK